MYQVPGTQSPVPGTGEQVPFSRNVEPLRENTHEHKSERNYRYDAHMHQRTRSFMKFYERAKGRKFPAIREYKNTGSKHTSTTIAFEEVIDARTSRPQHLIQIAMASYNESGKDLTGAAKAFRLRGRGLVEEEQPSMRAVALVHEDVLLRVGPHQVDSSKLAKLDRPTPVVRRSSSIAVKQVWNEENWKVPDPLEQVPADFPLERTHREILDASANEVANRISNTLRLLSVDAVYDGEKAKAKCTTGDCVSFCIRLFAGGDDGTPVVVEVQRRNGSASSFIRVCRKILDGAEGSIIEAETKASRKNMPTFMKTPIGSMKCLQGIRLDTDAKAQANASIEKSMELLRSRQKDTNLLGLENLCNLTDPLKTRPDVALNACKAILLYPTCADIRDEIGVILQKDAFLPEEFENDGPMNYHDQGRHKALVLLSNTLVMTGKDGCLDEGVKTFKWFTEFLILSLLDEVKAFENSANNSYEAACGLNALAVCSDVARRVMKENAAGDDLRTAYHFGTFNHELLANECERALEALGEGI